MREQPHSAGHLVGGSGRRDPRGPRWYGRGCGSPTGVFPGGHTSTDQRQPRRSLAAVSVPVSVSVSVPVMNTRQRRLDARVSRYCVSRCAGRGARWPCWWWSVSGRSWWSVLAWVGVWLTVCVCAGAERGANETKLPNAGSAITLLLALPTHRAVDTDRCFTRDCRRLTALDVGRVKWIRAFQSFSLTNHPCSSSI